MTIDDNQSEHHQYLYCIPSSLIYTSWWVMRMEFDSRQFAHEMTYRHWAMFQNSELINMHRIQNFTTAVDRGKNWEIRLRWPPSINRSMQIRIDHCDIVLFTLYTTFAQANKWFLLLLAPHRCLSSFTMLSIRTFPSSIFIRFAWSFFFSHHVFWCLCSHIHHWTHTIMVSMTLLSTHKHKRRNKCVQKNIC